MSESDEPYLTHDIDWPMLDKARFIPLNLLSTFIVRSFFYPITLVRTRLQVQVKSSIYRGTWHALCTTVLYEGFRSLYKGFYRGYLISTFLFSLTSAIWWPSYYYYQRQMFRIEAIFSKEFSLPLIVIQCIAGPLSSLTSTMLTNPLDVCRTRIQVEQQRRRMTQIMYELWQEERFHVFTKGLTARLSHSCIYSLLIIFGYETVNRVSLK
ncbi:unnamed protein product [Rotaria sp. Silwood1]|nr:unnamed protein product [Rotaria sp. Silwood1]